MIIQNTRTISMIVVKKPKAKLRKMIDFIDFNDY